MPRVTGTKPEKIQNGASAATRPTVHPEKHAEEDRSHFVEAQAESGRQMRAFIQEQYGDAE